MRALPLVLMFASSGAVYVSIQDSQEAYPLLRRVGSGETLRWGVGELALLRLSSAAVRVSNRGARFVQAQSTLHGLSGWGHSPCRAATGLLCRTPGGTGLFPEEPSLAVIPGSADLVADPFAAGIASQPCLRYASRLVQETDTYSVTLCDITQKGLNLVVAEDGVYALDRDEHLWFYLVVSIGTVVLVTAVAQNIASLLQEDVKATSRGLELFCALVLIAVSSFGISYITLGDMLFHYFTVAYVALNTAYWALSGSAGGIPVNMLLGTLMLTLCRLYNGIECEYVGPLLFLLLTRCFDKALTAFRSPLLNTPPFANQVFLVLDFLLAGLAYQYGVRALFTRGGEADALFVVMVLLAYSLAVFLHDRSI